MLIKNDKVIELSQEEKEKTMERTNVIHIGGSPIVTHLQV